MSLLVLTWKSFVKKWRGLNRREDPWNEWKRRREEKMKKMSDYEDEEDDLSEDELNEEDEG